MVDDTSKVNRRSVLKTVGATGVVGLAGCISTDGNGTATDPDGTVTGSSGPDTITFGQPAALTGQWDFLQPGVSQAADAAVQHINDAGGPLGAELSISRRDTAVNPQEARTVVTQLLENDNAAAILGLFSSEINPLWNFLQEQQAPILTPWPGSTFLDTRGGDKMTPSDTSDDEWVWRPIVGDTVHTSGNATYTLDQGYNNIGVLTGNTEGERSYVNGFLNTFEANGGTVANRVEVSLGQSNYQSALNRLFQADFDAFLVSFPQESAITALSDWADGGYGGQPILSDTLAQQAVIDQVGSGLNGAWAATPGQSGPSYDTFEEIYQQAGDAEINGWTPPSWDAAQVAALAIERAGEASHEAIQKNIGKVTRSGGTTVSTFAEGKEALANGDEISYQGAATPTNFTAHGNVFGSVTIRTAQDGEFVVTDEVAADAIRDSVPEGEY
ncbi:amino acid/amide ABC transporter substrate-binding protein (HAAT family) [Haloarcula quadrata]|uniref:Amino acid/amide ABC transporter substrate-binding protein (HAAT family) n=1 Tax=Haloarcula quadrata TaxID=182779 RepID=A0A495QQF0_9EURY|nr:ABC transporter substrate-binding protein [Haloarcula quadrata]RKS75178.1 amino acid/amide ABC transporter substrate-binding protein (HAAT family) [Haloarcula quadrata]